jgi:hypothetical protein
VFNLGGVSGALIIATCMTRFGSKPVIVTFSIAAIVLTLALGGLINASNANSSLALLLSLMLIAGWPRWACRSGSMRSPLMRIQPAAARAASARQ